MYEKPQIAELGSLSELTQALNKLGKNPDMYSAVVPIIGSIVPAP